MVDHNPNQEMRMKPYNRDRSRRTQRRRTCKVGPSAYEIPTCTIMSPTHRHWQHTQKYNWTKIYMQFLDCIEIIANLLLRSQSKRTILVQSPSPQGRIPNCTSKISCSWYLYEYERYFLTIDLVHVSMLMILFRSLKIVKGDGEKERMMIH